MIRSVRKRPLPVTQAEPILALPERFTLFLARHATPDRSRFDLPYHSPPGPSLTERGREEAVELGEFLRCEGLAHLLASPLERAMSTASIAGELSGAPVECNADLMEWQPGETEQALRERVERALRLAAQVSSECGVVGLFTHGAPILTLLKGLGLPEDEINRSRIYDSRNPVPPAGAWLAHKNGAGMELRLAFVPAGVRLPVAAGVLSAGLPG
jgi:2,3-bisphosphoglycerate-dependent phosphoglycerate mutase